jgi:hypothetical protein
LYSIIDVFAKSLVHSCIPGELTTPWLAIENFDVSFQGVGIARVVFVLVASDSVIGSPNVSINDGIQACFLECQVST